MKRQVFKYNKTFFVVGFKNNEADEGMPKITFSR